MNKKQYILAGVALVALAVVIVLGTKKSDNTPRDVAVPPSTLVVPSETITPPPPPRKRVLGTVFESAQEIESNVSQQTWSAPANDQVQQVPDGIQYVNNDLGFSVTLPVKWKDFRIVKKGNFVAFGLHSSVLASMNINGGYGNPLTIAVFPKDIWQESNGKPFFAFTYITEDSQGNVFAYGLGQDDEGYDGFPAVVPGVVYHGPFYEAQTLIIPSFKVLE
jgi:hypothetical protein